jgi:two-component system chemotaxis response regulator CheB
MDNRIKAFVVDDSGFVIASVKKKLASDPEIDVVGSAQNGREAIEKIRTLKPDVITLDVVMPEMDGLAVLEQIMAWQPTPVVMLSALTSEGAETTIKALELGAVDFFLKPSILRPTGTEETGDTLIEKVKRAARSKLRPFDFTPKTDVSASANIMEKSQHGTASCKFPVICIGSSTGGPRALMEIIPALPKDFPAAILMVQHMPPIFTKSLAERLGHASHINVIEASDGSTIEPGKALLAPGSFHMVVQSGGTRVSLNQEPTVHGVRPAIDVTMNSAVKVYGDNLLGVILTGMGSDGTVGAAHIKEAGGKIIAEDESTCAVFGMPQVVIKAGYADKVLPVDKIAQELIQIYCGNRQPALRS